MVLIKRTTGNYSTYGKLDSMTLIAPIQAIIDGDSNNKIVDPTGVEFGKVGVNPGFPPTPGTNVKPYITINHIPPTASVLSIPITAFQDVSPRTPAGLSNGEAIEIIGPLFNIDGNLVHPANSPTILVKDLIFQGFLVDAYVGSFISPISSTELIGSPVFRKSDGALIGMYFFSTTNASGIQLGLIFPASNIS